MLILAVFACLGLALADPVPNGTAEVQPAVPVVEATTTVQPALFINQELLKGMFPR